MMSGTWSKTAPDRNRGCVRTAMTLVTTVIRMNQSDIVWLWERTSGVTLKPANGGQGKTGQRKWPGTKLFYPTASCAGKSVLVRSRTGANCWATAPPSLPATTPFNPRTEASSRCEICRPQPRVVAPRVLPTLFGLLVWGVSNILK